MYLTGNKQYSDVHDSESFHFHRNACLNFKFGTVTCLLRTRELNIKWNATKVCEGNLRTRHTSILTTEVLKQAYE